MLYEKLVRWKVNLLRHLVFAGVNLNQKSLFVPVPQRHFLQVDAQCLRHLSVQVLVPQVQSVVLHMCKNWSQHV